MVYHWHCALEIKAVQGGIKVYVSPAEGKLLGLRKILAKRDGLSLSGKLRGATLSEDTKI